jgi:hypothetical protein
MEAARDRIPGKPEERLRINQSIRSLDDVLGRHPLPEPTAEHPGLAVRWVVAIGIVLAIVGLIAVLAWI